MQIECPKGFIEDYPNLYSKDLEIKYNLKHRQVERWARSLHLKKTPEFWLKHSSSFKKTQKEENEMNLDKTKTEELLEEVSKRGFISTKREILIDRHYKLPRKLKPFKIGVVSDTHLGSTQQQLTLLKQSYKEFKEEGIKIVFHTGDVVEGDGKLFKGQIYEMFQHGSDAMIEYTIANYPKEKGITTYMIGGSHDYSFFKSGGTDVLQAIAKKRKDIKYLGMFGAYFNIGGIVIYIMHGDGGGAYARSYKMQKIIEQFPPDKKPNILLLGHYHVNNMLPNYRNVVGCQLSCFQTQTHYLRAKGLGPDVGHVILEIFPDTKGLSHVKSNWKTYYNTLEGDF